MTRREERVGKGHLEKFDVIFGDVEQEGLEQDLLNNLNGLIIERFWDVKSMA